MRRRLDDIIIVIIIFIFSIIFLFLTPQEVLTRKIAIRHIPFKTWAMPVISLSMLSILCIVLLVTNYWSKEKHAYDSTTLSNGSILRVIITYIILVIGACLINVFGFVTTSVLLTGVLLTYFGVRNYYVLIIVSIAIPLFIYLFFYLGMKIPLPRGILF